MPIHCTPGVESNVQMQDVLLAALDTSQCSEHDGPRLAVDP